MKTAKSAVCCLMILLIITTALRLPFTGPPALAESARYARADAKDIYFCEKKDLNSALFAIPYTYCVEILSENDGWYYVKYAEDNSIYRALYGYCLTEKLTPLSEPPENIYLNMPVTVTFKADAPSGSLPVLGELDVTVAFYGVYRSGASDYSYVLYDGKFGYVYGAHDDYPLNDISDDQPPANEGDESKKTNTALIIALVLTGLSACALLVLYFTSRRKPFPPDK